MFLGCGSPIHVRCFRIPVMIQIRKIRRQKRKIFRILGVFGIPLPLFLCNCPGCNEHITSRDLAILVLHLKKKSVPHEDIPFSPNHSLLDERYMGRTPSPNESLLAELQELSDISERDFE